MRQYRTRTIQKWIVNPIVETNLVPRQLPLIRIVSQIKFSVPIMINQLRTWIISWYMILRKASSNKTKQKEALQSRTVVNTKQKLHRWALRARIIHLGENLNRKILLKRRKRWKSSWVRNRISSCKKISRMTKLFASCKNKKRKADQVASETLL